MKGHDINEIARDELNWDEAVVVDGSSQPGSVVSVRLSPAETERLRSLSNSLGLNISQVLRRALAAFEPMGQPLTERTVREYVAAFTYGGTIPRRSTWNVVMNNHSQMEFGAQHDRTVNDIEPQTATQPTRITERVTL